MTKKTISGGPKNGQIRSIRNKLRLIPFLRGGGMIQKHTVKNKKTGEKKERKIAPLFFSSSNERVSSTILLPCYQTGCPAWMEIPKKESFIITIIISITIFAKHFTVIYDKCKIIRQRQSDEPVRDDDDGHRYTLSTAASDDAT